MSLRPGSVRLIAPKEASLTITAQERPRIGLLGMYTSHNLGDTAIVRMIIQQIRARIPNCEFIGINRAPEEAVVVHGIPALHSSGYGTPLRANGTTWVEVDRPAPRWLSAGLGTRRIVYVARRLDLLVMTGGGQIEDFFGGPNSQPRALFTWVALTRAMGAPAAFFGVGVDQIFRRSSRLLCVNAVRMAQMRSFRDGGSVELLRRAGLRAPCRIDPDPALALDTRRYRTTDWRDSNVVVVSPISYRTWTESREDCYDQYLEHVVAACEGWVAEGRRIRFVCSDIQMDPPVAAGLVSRFSAPAQAATEIADVDTVEGFLEHVAGARFVVASRLHALIFALTMETPVIAISPARKVTQMMSDAELDDYCLDMRTMSREALVAAGKRIETNQVLLRDKIAVMTAMCRSQFSDACDDLVSLLQRGARRH
jgi:polysaccharide pyruvyl transferase WcaK-like protein